MYKDLLEVFDKHASHIKFDYELLNNIANNNRRWEQKDNDYIAFLGGDVLGVHPIRYSSIDEEYFFVNVLKINEPELRADIYNTKGIDKTRNISSNSTYLTCLWLMYGFRNSKYIKDKDRDECIKECYLQFAYKAFSSLVAHYFSNYNADESQARLVIERMNNKFLIKKLGTWKEVFDYNATIVMSKSPMTGTVGRHYPALVKFKTDDITKAAADMQTRLRDLVKSYYNVLVQVREDQSRLQSSTLLTKDEEGEDALRDVTNNPVQLTNYVKSVSDVETNFIKQPLVHLIASSIAKLEEQHLYEALQHLIASTDDKTKLNIIEDTMEAIIAYLSTKGITSNYKEHVVDILTYLQTYLFTNSIKQQGIMRAKNDILKIIRKHMKLPSKVPVGFIVCGVGIYIFLRALYRN